MDKDGRQEPGTRNAAPDIATKLVLAARTDGLGSRLEGVLLARLFAMEVGCRFGFIWPLRQGGAAQFHAIESPESTFDQEFLTEHLTANEASNAQYVPVHDWNKAVEDARRGADPGGPGWIVTRGSVTSRLAARHTVAAAFASLRFSEAVRRALSSANDVSLPNDPVAIHLRAGDLVFGGLRCTPRFRSKVIPIPIAEEIIRAYREAGRSVILFNQEESGGRYLSTLQPVTLVSQIREEMLGSGDFSEAVRALFDIALMSRCETIVGGSSAFVRIAASIGGVQITAPGGLLSRQRQLAVIVREKGKFEGQYHRLYAASAFCSGALAAEAGNDYRRANDLLDAAARLDPDNHLYPLKIGINLCRLGEAAEGERVFADRLQMEFAKRARIPTLRSAF